MEKGSKTNPKSINSIVTIISLIINLILAIVSGYSAFRASKLENEKKKVEIEKSKIEKERQSIEKELFLEKNTPHLSTLYLITKIETLHAFIKSKESFPFAHQVERYRIFENSNFEQIRKDIKKLSRKLNVSGNIQFLVILNSSDINAFNTKLIKFGDEIVECGTIESHTALLIPIYYSKSEGVTTKISSLYKSIKYDSKTRGLENNFVENIKSPVNPSWIPTLGDLRGWGRASTKKDDSHLEDLPR